MDDLVTCLGIAVVIFITIFACLAFVYGQGFKEGERVLSEKYITPCEAELPRNQHCVLTAVPEEGK